MFLLKFTLFLIQAKEKLIEKQIRQNQEAEMKSLLTAQKRDYDVRKEQIKRDLGDANTPKRQREDSLRAHKESFEYSQAEEGQRWVEKRLVSCDGLVSLVLLRACVVQSSNAWFLFYQIGDAASKIPRGRSEEISPLEIGSIPSA